MKLNRASQAVAATLINALLSSVAFAHPGHGETGWMHEHSAAVIAGTVVLATLVIGGLVAARMASRGEWPALRQLGARIRRK